MPSGHAPITVLDLRDSPWVDGPGRTILDCAEAMDPSRVRIVVGAFDGGSPDGTAYEREARRRGIEVFRIKERRSLDLGVVRQVIDISVSVGADAVHSHDFRSDIVAFVCARHLDLPSIATAHGWIANDLKGRIRTTIDKLILRHADHVISVSEETRRGLGKWADSKRCTVIPNAVRVERYQPRRGPGDFRASHRVANDAVLIANIGRLSPEKGQAAFLEAAQELIPRYRNTRFVLFGLGPDRERLEQFVHRNGMSEHVIFAGYRDDMEVIYNEIDLVVQSSCTEGMPNVVIEAMLMEVPVIATDVGGTSEILEHRRTGLLVAPGQHFSLVASIEEFMANREVFLKMARDGRCDVMARFDNAHRVERLALLYEAVIPTRGSGR